MKKYLEATIHILIWGVAYFLILNSVNTISDFRKDNKKAIQRVCGEFITYARMMDLFGGELVSIDGSKFKASNSMKKNIT